MADYRSPALQMPHRKPVSGHNAGLQFHHSESPSPHHTPRNSNSPQPQFHRPRTASSSFLPHTMHPIKPMTPVHAHPNPQPHHLYHPTVPSRKPSNATSSTGSTGGNGGVPARHVSNPHADVRRSFSSRSTNSQSGYVAMMRRQRATVWSDRAQTEDPRLLAQRRAAKQRAMLELQGMGSGRSSTLLSGGKIRHNPAARGMSYNTTTMIGTGVPLRLSANEVGDEDDDLNRSPLPHHRTGSGRSSTASSRGSGAQQRPSQGRISSGSSTHNPAGAENPETRPDIPEIVETPAAENKAEGDHFGTEQIEQRTRSLRLHDPSDLNDDNRYGSRSSSGRTRTLQLHTAEAMDRPDSSYSAEEREESFGQLTDMTTPTGAVATAAKNKKVSDDLKRRGSVDDRTSTMTGVRLFVANPDLSD
ncbi:hypothetical protein VTO42DRAFT_6746 [Malbranchea cinnamomea]